MATVATAGCHWGRLKKMAWRQHCRCRQGITLLGCRRQCVAERAAEVVAVQDGAVRGGVIMVKWVEIEGPLPSSTHRFPAAKLEASVGKMLPEGTRQLNENGDVTATFNVAQEGDYILRAQAYADQAGTEPTRMEWRI